MTGQVRALELHRTKLVTCQTVAEALKGRVPEGVQLVVNEFGLHLAPEKLHDTLQAEVDRTDGEVETILFGYGMCSKGMLGLQARGTRLVIPRCDDCIALFLGSRAAYERQRGIALGTFYLTRGWIEHGGDPYTEYRRMAVKYGEALAMRLEKKIMENYTRLALIDLGDLEPRHREYARMMADLFGWRLDEVPGSHVLLDKLLAGEWDADFVVAEPGETVGYQHFMSLAQPKT